MPPTPTTSRYAKSRGSASSRGYNRDWAKLRNYKLANNPICEWCQKRGLIVGAEYNKPLHVDHIIPCHDTQGQPINALLFDYDNLQTLCPTCHNKFKQIQERTGVMPGVDSNGLPLDKNHAFYAC